MGSLHQLHSRGAQHQCVQRVRRGRGLDREEQGRPVLRLHPNDRSPRALRSTRQVSRDVRSEAVQRPGKEPSHASNARRRQEEPEEVRVHEAGQGAHRGTARWGDQLPRRVLWEVPREAPGAWARREHHRRGDVRPRRRVPGARLLGPRSLRVSRAPRCAAHVPVAGGHSGGHADRAGRQHDGHWADGAGGYGGSDSRQVRGPQLAWLHAGRLACGSVRGVQRLPRAPPGDSWW